MLSLNNWNNMDICTNFMYKQNSQRKKLKSLEKLSKPRKLFKNLNIT